MIEVNELAKRYGEIHALRGVSFTIRPGEVVGLLGPNGAGKSTAMRIVTGYLAPTSGSAKVNGREVVDDPIAAQRDIGYLPEGNPVYDDLRLIEALRFQAGMRGLRGEARARAIAQAMEAAGLVGMGRRVISTFSRGYQQRVGLAQALLHEPPILILDEPSSGLDPNQQLEMRALLRRLGRERTVVFSSHILPEVEAVCDRVLVIHAGQLVADGTLDEIRSRTGLGGLIVAAARGGAANSIRDALRALPFVSDVTLARGAASDAPQRFEVATREFTSSSELEAVGAALRTAGASVVELASRPATLEQVFRSLTIGSGAVAEPVPAAATEQGE